MLVQVTCAEWDLISLGHATTRLLTCVRNKHLVPSKYVPDATGAIAMQGHYHITQLDTSKIAKTVLPKAVTARFTILRGADWKERLTEELGPEVTARLEQ